MIKPTIFLGFVLLALVAFTVYEVESRVDNLSSRLSTLNEEVGDDKEAIHVLKAEWSYLNQPERIKEMSQKHFNLRNISSEQIRDVSDIPYSTRNVARAGEDKPHNQATVSKQ